MRFIAEPNFGCPIAGVFAVRFCAGVSFRALLPEAFLARSFAGPFPWVFPEGIFRASLREDGFYGLFRRFVFIALSRGKLFDAIFFEAGELSMDYFTVDVEVRSFTGPFRSAIFCRGELHGLFCEAFFPCVFLQGLLSVPSMAVFVLYGLSQGFYRRLILRHVFREHSFGWTNLVGFFVGAFSMFSFVGLLSRAILCRGDVHVLIFSSVFSSLSSNVFLRALFRRDFFRALFCKAFFVRFSAEPFSVHTFAGFLPCALCRGLLPSPLSGNIFGTLFRRDFPLSLFPGASPVNFFAWMVPIDFFAGSFSLGSLVGGFLVHSFPGLSPFTLPQWRVPWALSEEPFHVPYPSVPLRALFRRGFFRAVFRTFVLSHTSWQRIFPWAEPRGPKLCAFSQEHFPCTLLNRRFPGTFLRGFLRALFRGAVSPGIFSKRRCPWSAFGSLPWNVFLRALFRRDFFLALFWKVFFVHFCAEPFSMHSSQGCLPCAFVQGFIPKPSFRNLFRHDLPQRFSLEPFPGGMSRAFFCMDGFHGLFRRVALSRKIFHGNFFWGLLHGFFVKETSLGTFAGAFMVHSVVEPFYFALLCSGDFYELSRGGLILVVFCSRFFA